MNSVLEINHSISKMDNNIEVNTNIQINVFHNQHYVTISPKQNVKSSEISNTFYEKIIGCENSNIYVKNKNNE